MRLFSTEESVKRGEVSILAIAETLSAIYCSYLIGVWTKSWWHIPIGATVGLFTLLRTNHSCMLTLVFSEKYTSLIRSFSADNFPVDENRDHRTAMACAFAGFFFASILYVLTPLAAVCLRVVATGICLGIWFRESIAAIPGNFLRSTISVDLFVSPEFFPMPDDPELQKEMRSFNSIYHLIPYAVRRFGTLDYKATEWWEKILYNTLLCLVAFLVILVVISVIAIAIAYRFSIKMTALVWFPLWWATTPIHLKPQSRSWGRHIEIIWDCGQPQFDRLFSSLTLVAFSVCYTIWVSRWLTADWLHVLSSVLGNSISQRLVDSVAFVASIVYPGAIPIWQIAAVVNAFLGIVQSQLTRKWLIEFRHGDGPFDSRIESWLVPFHKIRRALSAYVGVCNLYIAYRVARFFPIPRVDPNLFPWSGN